MILIIGVRFRKSGKVYYFDPAGLPIDKGKHVIVETARGVEYGTVVLSPRNIDNEKVIQPLKPVIRLATEEDDNINTENILKEKEAFDICLEKIKKHKLKMKLIDSEYTFDKNKLLFYFTADGRIDFRELVKELAAIFKTRIELRQIGVRDEVKRMHDHLDILNAIAFYWKKTGYLLKWNDLFVAFSLDFIGYDLLNYKSSNKKEFVGKYFSLLRHYNVVIQKPKLQWQYRELYRKLRFYVKWKK